MELLEIIKHLVSEIEIDSEKFYSKGNSAAAVRARLNLQKLKETAQLLRVGIQEEKKSKK